MIKQKYKSAFTLAEVLVTLAIIGVVGSLTVPAVVKNTQETSWHTAFKKNHAAISQAYKMVAADHNGNMAYLYPDCGGSGYCTDAALGDDLAKYLPYTKRCNRDNVVTGGCLYSDGIKFFNSTDTVADWRTNSGAFVLTSGAILVYSAYPANEQSCTTGAYNVCQASGGGWVFIDVNGFKEPNMIGKDVYVLYLTINGPRALTGGCHLGCICDPARTDEYNGLGCAAKVLQNEDY